MAREFSGKTENRGRKVGFPGKCTDRRGGENETRRKRENPKKRVEEKDFPFGQEKGPMRFAHVDDFY